MNEFNQGFPPSPSDKDDLLSQISSQDTNGVGTKSRKSRHSITMEFVILFMKITFILDDVKRKNQKLFTALSWVWGVLMILIYMGGAGMLCLLIYSYTHFPDVVRQTLINQNIVVKDYDMSHYSFSRIELNNLEDKEGTYTIKKMAIHSTFSDFIRGRVKSVVLDGVKIKIHVDKNGLKLGALPETLVRLNHRPVTNKIKVDSLSLTNAVLEINGKDYKLPVNFSLTGIYENKSKITIPLSLKDKYANISGTLNITGNSKEMDFGLQINAGTLTLPQRSPENVSGEMNFSTRNMKLEKMNGSFNFSYGKNTKKIGLNFIKGRDQLFRGEISLAFQNLDSYDKNKEIKSNLVLNFDGLDVNSIYHMKTNKPIKAVVQSFQKQNVQVSNLSATLNGSLVCDNFDCSYTVRQFSPVFIKESRLTFNSDVIRSANEYSFSLAPNKQESFSLRGGKIGYNILVERAAFSGYKNAPLNPVSLSAGSVALKGVYTFSTDKQTLSLDVKRLIAVTPEFTATNVTYKNANLFDENARIQMSADKISLNDNEVLKAPFKLSLDKKGLNTKAVLGLDNNAIQISFSGLSRLMTGEFKGNVYMHAFDLGKIKTPLGDISSLFPDSLTNQSGQVAALGTIYWKNAKQISGPLYVSFKDVGFKRGDVEIQGLNSVLALQTVEPLTTASGQELSIASIKGPVPLQNVLLNFKLDNQFIKLSNAFATLAGIPLQTDGSLIALRSNVTTLYFKNNAVNWAAANPYLNLYGMTIAGKGSVSLPVEVRWGQLGVKNAEIKMTNGEVNLSQLTNDKLKAVFGGADSYFVRTGTVYIDGATAKDGSNITLSFDGRLVPTGQLKNIRDTAAISLVDLIKPSPQMPVPAEIVKKQQIISK